MLINSNTSMLRVFYARKRAGTCYAKYVKYVKYVKYAKHAKYCPEPGTYPIRQRILAEIVEVDSGASLTS